MPGRLALRVCPDFLDHLSDGYRTIIVTGTNGKTTTTRMISHMLASLAIDHVSNREGANEISGIATTLGVDFRKRKTKPVAVLECDEYYLKAVAKALKPAIILVTNIAEDQTYRLISVDHVTAVLVDAIAQNPRAICCVNGGNEACLRLKDKLIEGMVIDHQSYASDWQLFAAVNLPGKYNRENAAAACTVIKCLGLDVDRAAESLKHFKLPFGRMETLSVEGRDVLLVLAKNAVNLDLVIETCSEQGRGGTLIFAVNNEMADDITTDWIGQAKIEAVDKVFSEVLLCGKCAGEVKQRFFPQGRIITSVIDEIRQSSGRVTIIANYTAMMQIRGQLSKMGYTHDFRED
ncbi:MAG: MurT ligase domain-containing protein [Lachnospiraceae bacterium]|nr:MurT ligase domain-containing protein [Lachnospiraceae bacterium]